MTHHAQRKLVRELELLYFLLYPNHERKQMPTDALGLIASITAGVQKLLAGENTTPTTNFATPDVLAALTTLNGLANPTTPTPPSP